jgi:hypothetical protein
MDGFDKQGYDKEGFNRWVWYVDNGGRHLVRVVCRW